jgi:putative tryptophan/tyrosine transport system substrate-binding protein
MTPAIGAGEVSVRRREFMTLLGGTLLGGTLFGGAVAGWPIAARARQSRSPVIGFLSLGSPDPSSGFGAAFRAGLAEAGYVPGHNVTIESRWANSQPWLLPQLAADLVARHVDVIVATGSSYTALAAKAATSTIPVVFAIADDPVQNGLVASLNRPGGTLTGMTFLGGQLAAKRLNLLLELVPQAATIGFLSGPAISPIYKERKHEMLAAGRSLEREIVVAEVRYSDFEAAFAALVEQRVEALVVGSFTLFRVPQPAQLQQDTGVGSAPQDCGNVSGSSVYGSWGLDELRFRYPGRRSTAGQPLCRTGTQRRKARRSACAGTRQV